MEKGNSRKVLWELKAQIGSGTWDQDVSSHLVFFDSNQKRTKVIRETFASENTADVQELNRLELLSSEGSLRGRIFSRVPGDNENGSGSLTAAHHFRYPVLRKEFKSRLQYLEPQEKERCQQWY